MTALSRLRLPVLTGTSRSTRSDQPAWQGCLADEQRNLHPAAQGPAKACSSRLLTLKFFDWAYNNGDKTATELTYVPLPASVKDMVRKSVGPGERCLRQSRFV
jgi:hypothetical protein